MEDAEGVVVRRRLVGARLADEAVAPRVVAVTMGGSGGEDGDGGGDVQAEAALQCIEEFTGAEAAAAGGR